MIGAYVKFREALTANFFDIFMYVMYMYSSLDRSVLDEVEAMRAYNEEIEHLNEVARNRPRAQLVLGKERCSFSQ